MESSFLNESRLQTSNASPLMFESEDEDELEQESANSSNKENNPETDESCTIEPTKEEKIFKGLQAVMLGIPPPPAFTVPQLDCREILKLWRDNQSYLVPPSTDCKKKEISANLVNEAASTAWPAVLDLDQWDVYYNRSTVSEEVEKLCSRYKERYVGAETSSSINSFFKSPSRTASARKRARTRAWGHSPGRRLSHLARRRKAFSSANLCSVAGNKNPDKKMIMVEIKKMANRQKRKNSAKKTKPTPKKPNPVQASTYKRALFQSPDQLPKDKESQTPSSQCIQRSKRNLFAVDSSSEKTINQNGKRERPVTRRVSPRKRVNRSLSFQENSQTATVKKVAAPLPQPPVQTTLTGAHKQKMLWAVTNALREEGMGMSHELFRPCMSVMFKSCQRLWLTRVLKGEISEGSTSENMLALAKQFTTYTIKEIGMDPTSEHMALVCANILRLADNKPLNDQSGSAITSKAVQERKTKDQALLLVNKSQDKSSSKHQSEKKRLPSVSRDMIKSSRPKQSPNKTTHKNSSVIKSPWRLRRMPSVVSLESDLKKVKYVDEPRHDNNVFHKPSPIKVDSQKNVFPKTNTPGRITGRRVSNLKFIVNNDENDDNVTKMENTLFSVSSQLVTVATDQDQSSMKKSSPIIKSRESKGLKDSDSEKEKNCSDKLSLLPVNSKQNVLNNLSPMKTTTNEMNGRIKSPIIQLVPCDLVKQDNIHSPNRKLISPTLKKVVPGKVPIELPRQGPCSARRVTRSSSSSDTIVNTENTIGDIVQNSPLPILVKIAESPEKINSQWKEQCILQQKENIPIKSSYKTIKANNLEKFSPQIASPLKGIHEMTTSDPRFPCSATLLYGSPCNSYNSAATSVTEDMEENCSNNSVVSTTVQDNMGERPEDVSDSSKLMSCDKDSVDQFDADKKTDSYYETNKENIIKEKFKLECNVKGNDKTRNNPSQRHFSSLDNRPNNLTVGAEPMNRTLQLYRMSNSGGENVVCDAGKPLPVIDYDEAPLLIPHWEESSVESDSAPSLVPHWEQQSNCSGTSTSLPESIMAHWQNIPALANTSDKVMFDFEDTSYEITFPTEDDDTRASSTCAPFDFSHFIDDSKSGFNTVCSTRNADSYNR